MGDKAQVLNPRTVLQESPGSSLYSRVSETMEMLPIATQKQSQAGGEPLKLCMTKVLIPLNFKQVKFK